ncbi:bifunctional adenosylcobinamide kinase/adenosylcobinamide-phosphate guanylyltransferase [Pseudobacillus sp. FSL P4-0506]|uniref:bifunctional adenosylcobinamide kinase/adenosylcobinamide-phosphate guanylyltransferase n=1 Tax=unclassified Pseudobacillus TaxID=2619284 RepID=UPI0030FD01A0
MEKAELTLIVGGVRSGKSKEAERHAVLEAERLKGALHYVACGKITDEEMAARVCSHQRERKASGKEWTTWEQPVRIETLSERFTQQDTVLIDCLTTLLTNEWFAGNTKEEEWADPNFHMSVTHNIRTGIDQIRESAGAVIIVSNELAYELLGSSLVFYYAKALGELHQWLINEAALAVLVEHGCPLVKKERLKV